MVLSNINHSPQTIQPSCYFSYNPHPSDHWSVETPLPSPSFREEVVPDPHNPLLAARPLSGLLTPQTMDASRLLQLQTAAAHPQSSRPKPQPHQDVLDVSYDSSSSRSSFSSDSTSSTPPNVCCSRCQTTYGRMVAYSINSYYCARCAKLTGYGG